MTAVSAQSLAGEIVDGASKRLTALSIVDGEQTRAPKGIFGVGFIHGVSQFTVDGAAGGAARGAARGAALGAARECKTNGAVPRPLAGGATVEPSTGITGDKAPEEGGAPQRFRFSAASAALAPERVLPPPTAERSTSPSASVLCAKESR